MQTDIVKIILRNPILSGTEKIQLIKNCSAENKKYISSLEKTLVDFEDGFFKIIFKKGQKSVTNFTKQFQKFTNSKVKSFAKAQRTKESASAA